MFIPTLVRRCHRFRDQTDGGDASPPSLAQTAPILPLRHVSHDAHGDHTQRPQPLQALLHGPFSSHASALHGAVPSQATYTTKPTHGLIGWGFQTKEHHPLKVDNPYLNTFFILVWTLMFEWYVVKNIYQKGIHLVEIGLLCSKYDNQCRFNSST